MNSAVEIIVVDGYEVARLSFGDHAAHIAVGIGNTWYDWRVNGGENLLWFPYELWEYKAVHALAGNPFMHPWANRLECDAVPVGEALHRFEGADIYRDGNGLSLHGLLLKSPYWKTVGVAANESGVSHEAELNFEAVPEYMEIFPFAHSIRMKHRLDKEGMSVTVHVRNTGGQSMPLSFGFHPYFSYADVHRSELSLLLGFRQHLLTNERLLPNGSTEEVVSFWGSGFVPLGNRLLDDGFKDKSGLTMMSVNNGRTIYVQTGEGYHVGVVYAPVQPEKKYLCIEPMVAPTNALHLHHQGKYAELPFVEPGEQYRAVFKVMLS